MPQYLVAMYLPDDYDPSAESEATIEEIHALNRELDAAGATKFACGLASASNAKTLRKQPDGKMLVTDGPYAETKEHIGGLMILEAANFHEALAWARKGASAGGAPVEVREILSAPPSTQGPGPAAPDLQKTSQRSPGGQFFVAIYHPDNYDPSVESKAMMEEIHALNREMIAAGARKFACGLSPASNAKTLRKQPDGKVLVTDGPYTETKEHIGGFWVLEAADLDEALEWGRKGAVACRASSEVREIFFRPAPEQGAGGSK
jgi:hypothetical protein